MSDHEISNIYLIRVKNSSVYKIGYAVDLDKRIRRFGKKQEFLSYRRTFPVPYDLASSIEGRLHSKLSAYRICKEWFYLPDDIVDYFEYWVEEAQLDAEYAREIRQRGYI